MKCISKRFSVIYIFSLLFQIHLGTVSFSADAFEEVATRVASAYGGRLAKHSLSGKVQAAVEAIALCHNVTPIVENGTVSYQAASPDEVFFFNFL